MELSFPVRRRLDAAITAALPTGGCDKCHRRTG